MKRQSKYLFAALLLLISYTSALAQAPNISYSPSTNVYPVGSAITPLTPANSGGAIPATTFGAVTTLVPAGPNLNNPKGFTTDGAGNIYEADNAGDVVRLINSSGTVTIIAGALSTPGEIDNATGTSARFNGPSGIVYDGSGFLYVTDNAGSTIRKINATAPYAVTTIAGIAGTPTPEIDNATGTSAKFDGPAGIAYASGTLYVTDNLGSTIRSISTTAPYAVTTIAGKKNVANDVDNATGTAARFNGPAGIVYDGSANLYVCDAIASTIRQISTTAPYAVITIAGKKNTPGTTNGTGTASRFSAPWGITIDASKNLYVADEGNNLIRMITTPGIVVTTLAGSGTQADVDGTGTAAEFYSPFAVAADNAGNLFVGDNVSTNSTCRKIAITGYNISPTILPTGLSFDSTTGIISGTPTASFAATIYTITGYNALGSSATTVSIACSQSIDWNGSTSVAWGTAANWTPAILPTTADKVQIGVNAGVTITNQPTINNVSGDVTINSITFGPKYTESIKVNAARTLTITGNLTLNAGTTASITGAGGGGTLIMAPTSAITVNGTSLTISTATFTLQSNANSSASIGPVTTTNFITSGTTVNVQRYVTGGSSTYRGYRLISSPVHAGTVSGNNVYNFDYIIASAYVLGSTGTGGGFDKTGNPTLFLFREDQVPSSASYGAGNWPGVSQINGSPTYNIQVNGAGPTYNMPVGNGVLFFFRGDRNAAVIAAETVASYPPTSTIFTATGTLNIGTVTVKDWFTPASSNLSFSGAIANAAVRGYTLAGNPYPSNIDWNTFSATVSASPIYGPNTDGSLYMLDPISKNYGVYNGGVGTNNATNIIPSGVGFFVRATAAGAQLVINESAKTTTQAVGPALMLGTPVASAPAQYLHLKMTKDSINSDETMLRIKSNAGTNFINGSDAVYKGGYGTVSLASHTSDNVDIAIKSIDLPKLQAQKLALNVNANTNGIYYLTLKDVVAIPQLYDIWLMDAYKKDSLDMRQNKTYSFNINKADSSSFGSGRFTLVIRQNAAYAYHLSNFTANKVATGRQVEVKWETQNEANYTNFTVERSIDGGKTFKILGGVDASGQGSYSFLDKSPILGQNIYRLQQQDVNNTISYSKIVTIQYANLGDKLSNNIVLFPNPASSIINLGIGSDLTGAALYNIRFMNSSGVVIKEITSAQSSWQGSISNLQPGTYLVRVTNNQTQTFIGESKFVKL